jgi:O-succinylbenzoate synthase
MEGLWEGKYPIVDLCNLLFNIMITMELHAHAAIGGIQPLVPHSATSWEQANAQLAREGHATFEQPENVIMTRVSGGIAAARAHASKLLPQPVNRIVSGTTRAPTDEFIRLAPGVDVPLSD